MPISSYIVYYVGMFLLLVAGVVLYVIEQREIWPRKKTFLVAYSVGAVICLSGIGYIQYMSPSAWWALPGAVVGLAYTYWLVTRIFDF